MLNTQYMYTKGFIHSNKWYILFKNYISTLTLIICVNSSLFINIKIIKQLKVLNLASFRKYSLENSLRNIITIISDYYFSSIEDMDIKYKKKNLTQYSIKHFIEICLYNWQIILVTDHYMTPIVGQEHVLCTFRCIIVYSL